MVHNEFSASVSALRKETVYLCNERTGLSGSEPDSRREVIKQYRQRLRTRTAMPVEVRMEQLRNEQQALLCGCTGFSSVFVYHNFFPTGHSHGI